MVWFLYSRLHGRYHELAPHLVPMDYTNDPDCKLPLALIVNMPELKVKVLCEHLHRFFSPLRTSVSLRLRCSCGQTGNRCPFSFRS